MQYNYVNMPLVYVNMQHNYVDIRLVYVNRQYYKRLVKMVDSFHYHHYGISFEYLKRKMRRPLKRITKQ